MKTPIETLTAVVDAAIAQGKPVFVEIPPPALVEEREINREWTAGNYDGAYGAALPDPDSDHWAYALGFYSSYEDDEGPEWLAPLRETHNAILDSLGIATD